MDIKAVTRRLDVLQREADRNRPCKMTVTFTDGHKTVTDPAGAIDLFREHGPFGAISRFEADRPEYNGLAGMMTTACHPVPDRKVSNFE